VNHRPTKIGLEHHHSPADSARLSAKLMVVVVLPSCGTLLVMSQTDCRLSRLKNSSLSVASGMLRVAQGVC